MMDAATKIRSRWRWLGWLVSFVGATPMSGCASKPAPVASEPPTKPAPAASTSPESPDPELAWRPAEPRPSRTIWRAEIERATARGPAYLLRQLGPEPFRHAGQFVGWRITRVFPEDPELCEPGCDLEVGDVILSVNGDRLQTPTAFGELFSRLPTIERLEVVRLRDGQRTATTYAVVDHRP